MIIAPIIRRTITISVLVVIVMAFFFMRSCRQSSPDIIAAIDSTQYWRTKTGEVVASMKQREQDYNKVTAELLDSIAALHNTKKKLISMIGSMKVKGSVVIRTNKDPIIIRDTMRIGDPFAITSIDQVWDDPYYHAEVSIPIGVDSISTIRLETRDTIRAVAKTVKEGGIFNRQTYLQIDVVSSNPYNKIYGLQVYKRPLPKPKKVGIGLNIGYGIGKDIRPAPYIGVGLNYNIIRL